MANAEGGPTYNYMYGWDLIAGTKQKKVNDYFKTIPDVRITGTMTVHAFGMDLDTSYDFTFRAPSLKIKETSGRQVDVNFPISGTITFGGLKTVEISIDEKTQYLIVTVQLAQIEALLQDKQADKLTKFDLILDLKSKDIIVDFNYEGFNPAELAVMIITLKKMFQEKVSEKHRYIIASFYRNNDVANPFKPFIPHLVDYTFVNDNNNIHNGNILVLMLTVNKKTGSVFFNAPILPDNEDFVMMVNNHLFFQELVYPKLIAILKEVVKNKDDLESSVIISPNDLRKELWTIQNNRNIDLYMHNGPWIKKFECKIDESVDNVHLYFDAKSDDSFLSFFGETWQKTWQKLKNKSGRISIEKAVDQHGKSNTDIMFSLLGGFATNLINLIQDSLYSKLPVFAGAFDSITNVTVTWPFQEYVAIKEILTPGHVVVTLDVRGGSETYINDLVAKCPVLHSNIGKMAREALVGRLKQSSPKRLTEPFFKEGYIYLEIFFPKHSAYEDDITTIIPALNDLFWLDFSTTVLSQSKHYQTHDSRKQSEIDILNFTVKSYNEELHKHAFDWYKYVFTRQVYGYTPNHSTKDIYLKVINDPHWIQLRKHMYSQGEWENPEWKIFHHCVKLSCLGASDDEINGWIGNCTKGGLNIPNSVGENKWRNYLVWLIPTEINHEDVDSKAKAAPNVLYLKVDLNSLNFTVSNQPGGVVYNEDALP